MPRTLGLLVLVFLWGALIEDAALFVVSWWMPEAWFHVFHRVEPEGMDVPLLRRSAGQWLAFAVFQGLALWRHRVQPIWLPLVAGLRLSDLFTDVSYLIAAPAITPIGWLLLVPPPFLNALCAVVMLAAYRKESRGERL